MSILDTIAHRPYALPTGRWRMAQRWNDLLFAHWPIPTERMAALLPASLEPDTFDGFAWVGVVPFWMDQVRTRHLGESTLTVPGTASFPELNLRTYVRPRGSRADNPHSGVYFFSLDAESPLAVFGARTLFHLPYFWARMHCQTRADGTIDYTSQRVLTRLSVRFDASYKPTGALAPSTPGSLAHFLTERYCLYTTPATSLGPARLLAPSRLFAGHIHHLPWPLETAEADIRTNELPAAHGLTLPDRPPILHFARELHVYIWGLQATAFLENQT